MKTLDSTKAKKYINLALDEDVYDQISFYSKDMGLTRGGLLRILVNRFLREKKFEWYRPKGY